MGKQARVRSLRKFIKDHAKANSTTPENVAATIKAADHSSGNRSTDEKLAVWYFIKKGILQ
jgi:hypothetical protein